MLPSSVDMKTAKVLLFRLILKLGGAMPAWRLCQQEVMRFHNEMASSQQMGGVF